MTWLVSLPAGVLILGWTVLAFGVALVSRWLVRTVVPVDEHDRVAGIASPLMPALGATFAVLMALTLSSEATYLRSAQDIVSNEAEQASRLAWASTSPGVDGEPIQAALVDYLRQTRAHEWDGDADPATAQAVATLQRTVREAAADPELGTPTGTELLAGVDGVTTERRARLANADHELPTLYVLTLVASGLALVANAGALVFRSSRRAALLVAGLAAVVGLSIALLFALTAPWDGAIRVSGDPIDSVAHDLDDGFFAP